MCQKGNHASNVSERSKIESYKFDIKNIQGMSGFGKTWGFIKKFTLSLFFWLNKRNVEKYTSQSHHQ
jgi:hypothetical protein